MSQNISDVGPRFGSALEHNILLMTDGYKFSHHKQYPVSWLPEHARPTAVNVATFKPPVLFPPDGSKMGSKILRVVRTPGVASSDANQLTIVTNASTTVVDIECVDLRTAADLTYDGAPVEFEYVGDVLGDVVIALSPDVRKTLNLSEKYAKVRFRNVDESKYKHGSSLNAYFEGGYNVSYFTTRAYKDAFEQLAGDGMGDHIVFFGLQYIIKEYLAGEVVTSDRIDAADEFIARFMADVRVNGPGFADGWDYTMFPLGDWEAIRTGDYDGNGGVAVGAAPGCLPIKIEALPEGSLIAPGVACFKLTNTHPRFYWLPNFLETLLVQVWYPTTVATQAREFRKIIQAYSVLSQRVSQFDSIPGNPEFTPDNIAADAPSVHVAQVFDLLDFGYRGVSSHETAMLGSAAYYTAGFEGSDTVAGSRMLLSHYGASDDALSGKPAESFRTMFDQLHCATSIPAAEHSTITSWADMDPAADADEYETAEYAAFTNMIRQYMPSFAVSLVSDGFNIWNAILNLWPSDKKVGDGASMREMIRQRTNGGQLTIVRPDSGEAVETLPQMLTLFHAVLPEVWDTHLPPFAPLFDEKDPRKTQYDTLIVSIRAKLNIGPEKNPFRRFKGQQFRILQGDGVALDTVGDMLASILANGFCANTVNFGSGGGLLQKVNRDSLSCAFKCCAMYVRGKMYAIGKDPIAGGKRSYAGNPAVIREGGVLRNRGVYGSDGKMITALPMTFDEFQTGAKDDELVVVFLNGVVTSDQTFLSVRSNAKITSLDGAITRALDVVCKKAEFFQRTTNPAQMAVRVAEAACGSKWMHDHNTKHPNNEFAQAFTRQFGNVRQLMSSGLLLDIDKTVCDKKLVEKVLVAVRNGDMALATKLMGDKLVLTR